MKTLTYIPLVLVLAACASAPDTVPATTAQPTVAPVATLDPVGAYEFSTVVDGQTVTGTLHIEGTPGSYRGRIITSVFPEIPVTAASVEGNVVNVKGSMPDGDLAIRMVMEGANFKGNWALGADSGEFNGKKLPR